MKGLYRNEMLKLIAQTSFKVILIIALVLSLLMPAGILALDGLFEGISDWDESEFYEDMLDAAEDPMEKTYYETMLESRNWFRDHGIEKNDWRYTEYFSEYDNLTQLIAAYRLLEKGASYEEVCNWFYIDDGYESVYSEKPFTIPGRWTAVSGDGVEDLPQTYDRDTPMVEDPDYTPPTAEEAGKYRALLEGERAALQKKLETVTVTEYYADRAEMARASKKSAEARVSTLQSKLSGAKNDVEREQLEYEIAVAELDAKCAGEVAESYADSAAKGYAYNDWHVAAGTSVREQIYQSLRLAVTMGKSAYFDEQMDQEDYENYCESQAADRKDAERALALLDYSLEHDLPIDSGQDDRLGGKAGMFSALGTAVSVTTLFLIVAAGMSVAREHTDGTIRLLLIRPRTRRKILLSKYLALLTYGYGLLLVSFLVQGTIFTLSSPIELLSGSALYLFGRIVTLPTLVLLLVKMLILSAGAWVLMSIAFFFSVVTKRSALAILLPILLNAAGGTVAAISQLLINSFPKLGFLRYTFLPYLDMEAFLHTPLESYSQDSFSIFYIGMGNATAGMNFPLGFAQLLLIGALFTFFAFRIFRRQQIKS